MARLLTLFLQSWQPACVRHAEPICAGCHGRRLPQDQSVDICRVSRRGCGGRGVIWRGLERRLGQPGLSHVKKENPAPLGPVPPTSPGPQSPWDGSLGRLPAWAAQGFLLLPGRQHSVSCPFALFLRIVVSLVFIFLGKNILVNSYSHLIASPALGV